MFLISTKYACTCAFHRVRIRFKIHGVHLKINVFFVTRNFHKYKYINKMPMPMNTFLNNIYGNERIKLKEQIT